MRQPIVMGAGNRRLDLLLRMVRDAERAVDHQIRAAEEDDDKGEQLIKLAVATIGGALSIALYIGQDPSTDSSSPTVFVYAIALCANLVAIVAFIDSYVGVRRPSEMSTGPGMSWIEEKRKDDSWTLDAYLASSISSYEFYGKLNSVRLGKIGTTRRVGLYLLFGSVVMYVAAISFIVLGTIQ